MYKAHDITEHSAVRFSAHMYVDAPDSKGACISLALPRFSDLLDQEPFGQEPVYYPVSSTGPGITLGFNEYCLNQSLFILSQGSP